MSGLPAHLLDEIAKCYARAAVDAWLAEMDAATTTSLSPKEKAVPVQPGTAFCFSTALKDQQRNDHTFPPLGTEVP